MPARAPRRTSRTASSASGWCSRKYVVERLRRLGAPDFPEVQDLQRRLARLIAARSAHECSSPRGIARRRRVEPRVQPRHRDSAAAAASRPLFAGPSPARAIASSAVFVVSTPNAIGTPRRLRGAHDAVRRRLRDVVEVRRLAANQTAQADDRRPLARLGDALRRLRQLVGAGHRKRLDASSAHARLAQHRARAGFEPLGDELVVLRRRRGNTHVGQLGRVSAP